MAFRPLGALALLLVLGPSPAHSQIFTEADRAAVNRYIPEAAVMMSRWIDYMDQRTFEAAWDGTAQLFRQNQDRSTWIATQFRLRQDRNVKRREVISSRYTRTLRPLSTIDAVTFQLALYFINETLGIETIVLVREDDGAWRVASYLYNPGPVTTSPAPLGY